MKPTHRMRVLGLSVAAILALVWPAMAGAFEGRINAVITRGNETNALLYTVGTGHVRIEVTGSTWPHPVNIVELNSGAVTLLFPHNRSFVRLKNGAAHAPSRVPADAPPAGVWREAHQTAHGAGALPAPSVPPAIGPQPGIPGGRPIATLALASPPGAPAIRDLPLPPGGLPSGIGPQPAGAGVVPAMPAMPMPMMPMPGEKLELRATTNAMTILGFPCVRYEVKQRGQTLEIWAKEKLLTYHAYLRNQPSRFGPRMLEEQWPALLEDRKLFPLRASLRLDNGAERFCFEVKSVTPEKITGEKLFQPPADYHELEPLPF